MLTEAPLKRTPLFGSHLALKAKMVPFGGWEMPVQYDGILAEYQQTRQKVSVFDISHMGEFIVRGDPRENGLDRIVTQNLMDMPLRTCRYGFMLNEQSGIMDDLIVFRCQEEEWMIVVNAATAQKDAAHFERLISQRDMFEDISQWTGKIDIQGPGARTLLSGMVRDIEKLQYYQFDEFDVLGDRVIVSRTGYTGELGYEIYYPWSKTEKLWDTLLAKGARPAGLGARDVLRIEMGYCLYGHEINENISPVQAGLMRFVDESKDFVGKENLMKEKERGAEYRLRCLMSDSRRSPRENYKIYSKDGREIGWVTSGTFSPFYNKGVGLGYIKNQEAEIGAEILFGEDARSVPAKITKRPLYTKGTLKN